MYRSDAYSTFHTFYTLDMLYYLNRYNQQHYEDHQKQYQVHIILKILLQLIQLPYLFNNPHCTKNVCNYLFQLVLVKTCNVVKLSYILYVSV